MGDRSAPGNPAPDAAGIARPRVAERDAEVIAAERYAIDGTARELGSNQDRNFVITDRSGKRVVLRVDNATVSDEAREAQHAAIEAFLAAGITVPKVLPGRTGSLTEHWNGYAVRVSEFVEGESLVDEDYLAHAVLRAFGHLAADSVHALEQLSPNEYPGLERSHMWDMRVAHTETLGLASSITEPELRDRVLEAAHAAHAVLHSLEHELPVQAIHGDLTDDNVMGDRGPDGRITPRVLIDLGDLSLGWRIAEVAVTISSMLHHDAQHPLRTLDTLRAYASRVAEHGIPIAPSEVRAVWPLVVLRAALLVASGWRQLELEGDNDYARARIDGERAIFDAATSLPLHEMIEQVCAALETLAAPLLPLPPSLPAGPTLLDRFTGARCFVELGVEAEQLAGGRWLEPDVEQQLIREALDLEKQDAVAIMPYGAYRLTRARVNCADTAATYPVDTELWFRITEPLDLVAPGDARVSQSGDGRLELAFASSDWVAEIAGLETQLAAGDPVRAGDILGQVPAGDAIPLAVGMRRSDAPPLAGEARRARLVAPERASGMSRLRPDPAAILGAESRTQRDSAAEELERRERIFAAAQERYYEAPMQIERGWQHHLVDTTGRAYVDMVNNVTGLGHGHPGVADAVTRQLRLLGTNSRFLYRGLAEYSERLLELFPDDSGFDTVLLVNSGSEAVDLAIRVAQAATERSTVVALREAYHGWTMASDAVTTSAFDNPFALANRPDWVHIADVPNSYRGTYRGAHSGPKYAADLETDLNRLESEGRPVAAFICESVLGNAGGVVLPDGYLAEAYERVRAAGGLTIADEVQVGFGRMGTSFWGFEHSGVLPDIVAIAKPMGNGFPIGGVITSQRIADALSTQGQFFSSAGGNPVSCAAGIAVLDAMRDEGLQENAHRVGNHLKARFEVLAGRHSIIGPVHGQGLYLGVELVRDRETLEPADAEAAAICERLRELGVIMLTTSERSNVLKVKPPLCLTIESADFVVDALDRVLTEGW